MVRKSLTRQVSASQDTPSSLMARKLAVFVFAWKRSSEVTSRDAGER